MIRLVQGEGEKRRLLALCEKTPFGCKIASIANSYGFDKSFANFWLNTEEDVVYCLVDGAMLLSGTVLQGDASREFLHVVGAREVLCAVRNAEAMNLTPTQVGDVLKHTQVLLAALLKQNHNDDSDSKQHQHDAKHDFQSVHSVLIPPKVFAGIPRKQAQKPHVKYLGLSYHSWGDFASGRARFF